MMKVIRITTSLDFGGIEKVFELHAKYHKRNYELIFVSLSGGGKAEDFIRNLGYRVIILNVNSKVPGWKCLIKLTALLRDEKPYVVHTCGGEANFHGLIAAFAMRVPRRIGEEIGVPNHSFISKIIFRIVYSTAHKVIAISNAVKQYLTSFEVPVGKVSVIYNPIDLSIKPQKVRVPHAGFRISSVGRLIHHKNLTILIDLVKILTERHPSNLFELWLIGDGTERGFLKEYAKSAGIENLVKFTGFVSEPQQLLGETDLFILPSVFEGFGLACIEAIQCGLPVIVSNSGGMIEYITDGQNGFLFDPHSLSELLQKTELLMKLDSGKLNQMISKASERVYELFSPDKYLNELTDIYQISAINN